MVISKHATMLEVVSEHGAFYPVLLKDAAGWMLVDTGFPLTYSLIVCEMARFGCEPKDITAIVLTHQDIDHIGNVKEFLAANPAIKVLAHEAEAPYIDGREAPVKLARLPQDHPFYPELKKGFDNRRFAIDNLLADGQMLPYCGGIQVLHTPGHTPGHICLYLPEDRVLIAGDALNIASGRLAGPAPEHTIDMATAIRSLEKLKTPEIDVVLTFHGGCYRGGVDL